MAGAFATILAPVPVHREWCSDLHFLVIIVVAVVLRMGNYKGGRHGLEVQVANSLVGCAFGNL